MLNVTNNQREKPMIHMTIAIRPILEVMWTCWVGETRGGTANLVAPHQIRYLPEKPPPRRVFCLPPLFFSPSPHPSFLPSPFLYIHYLYALPRVSPYLPDCLPPSCSAKTWCSLPLNSFLKSISSTLFSSSAPYFPAFLLQLFPNTCGQCQPSLSLPSSALTVPRLKPPSSYLHPS
jgi:hypothetical protein